MRAAGSPAGDFDTWAAGAADCAHALLGRVRGALPMLASAPGPGWRGAPWGRRQTRPAGFGEWPGGPGGPWRGWWPGSPGFPRGPKASRGDVRAAILALLREGPRNGYQIMSEIEERSGGAWRPSPGAVYPALQQLADEGLVEAEESSGRRTFRLTDMGRRHIEENPDAARTSPRLAFGPRGDPGGPGHQPRHGPPGPPGHSAKPPGRVWRRPHGAPRQPGPGAPASKWRAPRTRQRKA